MPSPTCPACGMAALEPFNDTIDWCPKCKESYSVKRRAKLSTAQIAALGKCAEVGITFGEGMNAKANWRDWSETPRLTFPTFHRLRELDLIAKLPRVEGQSWWAQHYSITPLGLRVLKAYTS